MHILCLGLNHTTAPLDLREKLAFSEDNARSTLARFARGNHHGPIDEMVIISTCNRTEIYTTCSTLDFETIEIFLADVSGAARPVFQPCLYRFNDEAAVDHLFRVAAGLDSLVLGEPQILGQVTRSFELAVELGTCGPLLSNLFRSAIHAGKRARAETAISRNAASVSSLAAELVEKELKNLYEAQVLVIGAGEMAELAVEAMRKRGSSRITVINRTLKKAQLLAERWQASAFTFKHLKTWLNQADIVISSTSAPHAIIKSGQMEEIMLKRSHKPLIMVDIAMPRNIDPEVGRVAGIRLYDLDTLEQKVSHHQAARSAEVPKVEAILTDEKNRFMEFIKTADMLPLISELRSQAEAIRFQELERTLHRLPGLSELERKHIDLMTRALVKKLLDSPTRRLRVEANCPHAPEFSTVARTLFDLYDDSDLCAFSKDKCSVATCAACPDRLS